jgi:hypothetical protein
MDNPLWSMRALRTTAQKSPPRVSAVAEEQTYPMQKHSREPILLLPGFDTMEEEHYLCIWEAKQGDKLKQ